MFDPTRHLRHIARGGAYRTHLLHVRTLVLADEHGVWHPASKAELRRLLATKDQSQATESEVELALRQCRSQGLVTRESDWKQITLAGAEVA